MGAFIIAGLVFAGTIFLSLLMLFASGMSDNPSDNSATGAISMFVTGTVASALILASHWLHIGW